MTMVSCTIQGTTYNVMSGNPVEMTGCNIYAWEDGDSPTLIGVSGSNGFFSCPFEFESQGPWIGVNVNFKAEHVGLGIEDQRTLIAMENGTTWRNAYLYDPAYDHIDCQCTLQGYVTDGVNPLPGAMVYTANDFLFPTIFGEVYLTNASGFYSINHEWEFPLPVPEFFFNSMITIMGEFMALKRSAIMVFIQNSGVHTQTVNLVKPVDLPPNDPLPPPDDSYWGNNTVGMCDFQLAWG